MLKKDDFTLFNLSTKDKNTLESSSCYCPMDSLSVLRCSGDKVRDYLHGQITQDITLLSPTQGLYTAILTPTGKCVSEAWLIESGENQIDMIFPSQCADVLVQRLRMFSLGYNLRIGVLPDVKVMAITHPTSNNKVLYSICPQYGGIHLPHAQWMIHHADMPKLELSRITDDCMQAWEIYHGIPRFMMDWDQSTLPLNAGLIQRQGISFDKGCYVGQEVASRMHWRKLIKSSFYSVSFKKEKLSNFLVNKKNQQIGIFHRVVYDELTMEFVCLVCLFLKFKNDNLEYKFLENKFV